MRKDGQLTKKELDDRWTTIHAGHGWHMGESFDVAMMEIKAHIDALRKDRNRWRKLAREGGV